MFGQFFKRRSATKLDEIAGRVRKRLEREKELLPERNLRGMNPDARQPFDFAEAFQGEGLNVIAEVKFASPSEGDIAPDLEPLGVAKGYLENGAVALSVLTEPDFFKGSPDYLAHIRSHYKDAHLLMKDFVVDPYQLAKAWVYGADAVLLIVALLGKDTGKFLAKAQEDGLSCLVEVHDEKEMKTALDAGATLIGVNNRNLKTMEVSLSTSEHLAKLAPKSITLISESGIKTNDNLKALRAMGYSGFLVGTALMKTQKPGEALSKLLRGAS